MARFIEIPQSAVPAAGQRTLVHHEGSSIVLFNLDGSLHAIENSCPHSGASLFAGKLQGTLLQCPAHGMRFDITRGCTGAQALELKRYPVTRDGDLYRINL